MVLDAALLNTQHYKVRIKGKMEQPKERSSTSLHLGIVAIDFPLLLRVALDYGRQLYLLIYK